MTKQMTMLDRSLAASTLKLRTRAAEAPVTTDAEEDPERVCQESVENPLEVCTTPNDPIKPTLPVDLDEAA